jgi:Cu/Ag efflux pump CusA
MLDRILHFSIERRWTVVAVTLAAALLGARALWQQIEASA